MIDDIIVTQYAKKTLLIIDDIDINCKRALTDERLTADEKITIELSILSAIITRYSDHPFFNMILDMAKEHKEEFKHEVQE